MRPARRMPRFRPFRVLSLMAGLAACATPPARAGQADVYLIGEDWVGRWRDGAVAASVATPREVVAAAVPDRTGGLWLLAYPSEAPSGEAADRVRLFRVSANTLTSGAPGGRAPGAAPDVSAIWPAAEPGRLLLVRADADGATVVTADAVSLGTAGARRSVPVDAVGPRMRAGRWLAPVPSLVGVDGEAVDPAALIDASGLQHDAAPPAWLGTGQLLALSRDAALIMPSPGRVRVVALADGAVRSERAVAAEGAADLRGALSPDGGTAIVFTAPADRGDRWAGLAWDVASGRALPSGDLFIDTGRAREAGEARSLACLLPGGAGAIFSLIGQPADRRSEAVLFNHGASRRVDLRTGYVKHCMIE